MTMSTIWSWQARALLAEVWDEPETEASRTDFHRDCSDRGGRAAGADHRDDVVAADGAGQSAQAGRDPALQAARRTILGGTRPGCLARPAAADERRSPGGSGRAGQGPDQPGAGRPRLAQAGRQGGQPKG